MNNLFSEDQDIRPCGVRETADKLTAAPMSEGQITIADAVRELVAEIITVIEQRYATLQAINETVDQRTTEANSIASRANLIATQAIEIAQKSAAETKEAIDQLRTDMVKVSDQSDAVRREVSNQSDAIRREVSEQSDTIAKQANRLTIGGILAFVSLGVFGLITAPLVPNAIAFWMKLLGF